MKRSSLTATLEILDRLISFDTVSSKTNLPLIEYVEDYLQTYSVSSRRYLSQCGTKANLWATIGKGEGGIIWSGHTDVVPVEGQTWTTDPFRVSWADDETVVGRGVTDMKGFLACCLALVPELVSKSASGPIHLCFSYDEEIGCLGVRSVVEDIAKWSAKPVGCIVGEPSNSKVITGHKTKRSLRAHVKGQTAHSSLAPTAVNAVQFAARLISHISAKADWLQTEGPRDELFNVPHTTAHVGRVQGGTQLNIVPNQCNFDFEFRVLPSSDADALVAEVEKFAATELVPAMRQINPRTGINFQTLAAFPGLDIAADHPWVTHMLHAAGCNSVSKVAYGAEAGLFQTVAGVPTVICGPGSIEDAHKPNEPLKVSELAKCLEILRQSTQVSAVA